MHPCQSPWLHNRQRGRKRSANKARSILFPKTTPGDHTGLPCHPTGYNLATWPQIAGRAVRTGSAYSEPPRTSWKTLWLRKKGGRDTVWEATPLTQQHFWNPCLPCCAAWGGSPVMFDRLPPHLPTLHPSIFHSKPSSKWQKALPEGKQSRLDFPPVP